MNIFILSFFFPPPHALSFTVFFSFLSDETTLRGMFLVDAFSRVGFYRRTRRRWVGLGYLSVRLHARICLQYLSFFSPRRHHSIAYNYYIRMSVFWHLFALPWIY